MSQSFRRKMVWAVIAILLLLGTALQVNAAPTTAPPGDTEEKSQQALAKAFDCTLALLTLHLPRAEIACGDTIELLPDSPLGYKLRGFTYLLQHRFERAETDFRQAVKLDARDPDNHAGLGQALSGQGRFREAADTFGIALAIRPDNVRYLAARCWARAGDGQDLTAALGDCNRAIKLAPDSALAYNARGLTHLKKKQNARAIRDYSKSLSLEKDQPSAQFGRGLAEWRLNQLGPAKSDMTLARQADPEIDDLYILVGVLDESCRAGGKACALPKELRSHQGSSAAPYLSVSWRHHPQH